MSCCSCSTVFCCLVWLALHVFVRSFEHLILIAFLAHGFQSIVSSNIFIFILVLPYFLLLTHCCRRPGCATKPRMGSLRHSQVMPRHSLHQGLYSHNFAGRSRTFFCSGELLAPILLPERPLGSNRFLRSLSLAPSYSSSPSDRFLSSLP